MRDSVSCSSCRARRSARNASSGERARAGRESRRPIAPSSCFALWKSPVYSRYSPRRTRLSAVSALSRSSTGDRRAGVGSSLSERHLNGSPEWGLDDPVVGGGRSSFPGGPFFFIGSSAWKVLSTVP